VQSLSVSPRKANQLLARISRRKRDGCHAHACRGHVPAPLGDTPHGHEDVAMPPCHEDVAMPPCPTPEHADSCLSDKDAPAINVYQRELTSRGWVDFDDLIALPLRLLAANPDLVDHYRSRYRWISVDEYQDIDAAQYQLIRLMVPEGGNLCVIGDPDQAIYGFRGAEVGYFQRFCEDFPTARTVVLARNYRSTQTIVDAALQLIAPASLVADRRLEARGLGPEQIEIHACATDRAEAELVVHTIERCIGGSTFFSLDSQRVASDEGQSHGFADFAVLYRTEAQAEPLVEALARSGMPFQRRSHKPLADEPLAMDADLWDPRADRVSLLTLHAAKGLEFPVVFIVGCEDGIVPLRFGSLGHKKGTGPICRNGPEGASHKLDLSPFCDEERALAEERRLFFVGMTRAQERLILTHARKRRWHGKVRESSPSPFLDDIQQRLLDLHQHRAVRKPAMLDQQRTLFEVREKP
jgi:DNA helicase II / ATP-dependent DNA helicase PcrA